MNKTELVAAIAEKAALSKKDNMKKFIVEFLNLERLFELNEI